MYCIAYILGELFLKNTHTYPHVSDLRNNVLHVGLSRGREWERTHVPINAGDIRGLGSVPGVERSPEEGMATHATILAWRTP